MALPDILITRAQGGLGRQQPTNDGISALLTQGVAIAGKLALDTDYELRSLLAAEALGIAPTGGYATTHQHISEYFRLSPGAVLLVRVVAQSVPLASILDKTQAHAKAMLVAANGRIKQLAVALNPAAGYVPAVTHGFDDDVYAAIAQAQALAMEEFVQHRPVLVLLGAYSLSHDPGVAADLTTLSSEFVGVLAGTDAASPNEPALGAVLGAVSAAAVNESIAWVQKFNLTGSGQFLSAGLSNGALLGQLLPGDLAAFAAKGYIAVRQHAGLDGFYFSDSPTCTLPSSDYAYLENVRTTNKAARLVRTALLPALNGPLPVNADGTLAAQAVGELQGKALAGLTAGLLQTAQASALAVYIDPTQNVLSTSQLNVQVRLVPVGVGRQIVVSLGLTTKLS